MKRIILIIAFISLFGCEDEPETDQGCMTGVPVGLNYSVHIRCCTKQQYLAGNNVNAGGTANWASYTDHKWEKCSSCK